MTGTVIDLLCGAGGLSLGFQQAGFTALLGTDFFSAAGKTFESSHTGSVFLDRDITQLSVDEIRDVSTLGSRRLDVLVGGPPCQGFSVYNHKRGIEDGRTSLYQDYLRVVSGLLPNWVVIENVPGMFSVDDGSVIASIVHGLGELGYHVEYRVLKTEEYGVPQTRRRVIFLANRIGVAIDWPEPTHGIGKQPFVTVREAIGDLPSRLAGESGVIGYDAPVTSPYQLAMRSEYLKEVFNHRSAGLSEINLRRLKHVRPGGSWRDIPVELLPKGMQKAKRSDHTKRYGRLRWDGLSGTILTKCDIHWGTFIHPDEDRPISVREAARFQGFPDDVVFSGTLTQQYAQVGNAVPPIIGKMIAETVLRSERTAMRATA